MILLKYTNLSGYDGSTGSLSIAIDSQSTLVRGALSQKKAFKGGNRRYCGENELIVLRMAIDNR